MMGMDRYFIAVMKGGSGRLEKEFASSFDAEMAIADANEKAFNLGFKYTTYLIYEVIEFDTKEEDDGVLLESVTTIKKKFVRECPTDEWVSIWKPAWGVKGE